MEHDAFIERAIQWDRNERLQIEAWEDKKKQLDEDHEHRKQLTSEVEAWSPVKKPDEPQEDEVVPVSPAIAEINEME